MKNKVLIFGKGFIGRRLQQEFQCPVSDKKITGFQDILLEIKKYKPEIIINCIGHTGKRTVDDCELAPDKTLSANTFIPILFGEAVLRSGIKLIHISSGCIYHFDYSTLRPISEKKEQDFYNLYYSRTKIYAENILEKFPKRNNILVVRIRLPLDNRPCAKNILTKIIGYKTVINVPNSITYMPDFVKALRHLIKIDARGIYNIVCKGGLKYSKLLDVYQKYVPDFQYQIMDINDFKPLRTNLILSTSKLAKTGFRVRTPNEVLEECVKSYIRYPVGDGSARPY